MKRAQRPAQSSLLLLDVVEILGKLNINYAVLGAMAASFHGAIRGSIDADAVISLTTEARADLKRNLEESGFSVNLRQGDPTDPIAAMFEIHDSFDNRVDLLVGLRGLQPDAFTRVVTTEFSGEPLKIMGLEDFIATKVFAGGPKDLDDAKRVLAVMGARIDRPLLETVTARFGKEATNALRDLLP